jgi:phage shock protein A
MFEDLRNAFKEALENFNKELNRDQVSEAADKLLVGMRNEIVDEKAAVAGLEEQIQKTHDQIERLSKEAATARRRETMARDIDDGETVELAAEYAIKVEHHHEVLRKKATALQEELDFRRQTLKSMYVQFEDAKEKRAKLKATTGRSSARETMSAASDLFDELDRMAEKIEGKRAEADAAEAFSDLDLDDGSDYRIELDDDPPEELDVDAALEELKRRMKERDGG